MSEKTAKAQKKKERLEGKIKQPNYTQVRSYEVKTKDKSGKLKVETVTEPVTATTISCKVHSREIVNEEIKAAHGNMSKFIPPKYGFGAWGQRKY